MQRAANPSLFGRWQIIEVNGAPVRALARDPAVQPNVTFTPQTYGGSSGCNSFGGNGLLLDGRWFAEPPMATQQGCGDLTEQESVVYRVLAGGPIIAWEAPDMALLRTASGTLRLLRIGATPDAGAIKPPLLMAGTRWELSALDGVAINLPGARLPARLTFEADRWKLETPCAAHGGRWRQMDHAVLLEPGTSKTLACGAALRRQSSALAKVLSGQLDYVVGPNGELVFANGRQWITGRRDATLTREDGNRISAEWRIVSVDGVTPPASERPAALLLGPHAFALWDGCRRSEGVAIAAERQLFTQGSGVVTLANCPRNEIRQKIDAVVAASPRIGLTENGGIALISRVGTLRLQRTTARPFGTSVEGRLQIGTSFDLATGTAASARLSLGPGDAFTLTLACGSFKGRWRNARGFGHGYARFSPERPPLGCEEDHTAMLLYNFFTGDVLTAISANRDIALFVNNGRSVRARVADARFR